MTTVIAGSFPTYHLSINEKVLTKSIKKKNIFVLMTKSTPFVLPILDYENIQNIILHQVSLLQRVSFRKLQNAKLEHCFCTNCIIFWSSIGCQIDSNLSYILFIFKDFFFQFKAKMALSCGSPCTPKLLVGRKKCCV